MIQTTHRIHKPTATLIACTVLTTALIMSTPAPASAAERILSMEAAIAQMLRENHKIRIQAEQLQITSDSINSALGEFDPYLFFELTWSEINRDQNALEFVSTGALFEQRYWEDDTIGGRSGIGAKNSFGTRFELSLSLSRGSNTVSRNNPTAIFDPEYESFLGITVTQPLLRGFGRKVNRAVVAVAELELGVTYYEKEILITNQLVELINAFHDIVYGQENLRVKKDALALAETLLADNRKRVELGRMSQLDITQAMVQISQAEEEVILAEDFLRDRKAVLARIMHGFPREDLLSFSVAGDLTVPVLQTLDAAALRQSARSHRPDYLLARALKEQEEVRRHYARNQLLPELDIKFSYGFTGLANNAQNSFRRMEDLDTTQWSVGVAMRVPIGNRRAKAEASAANRRSFQAEMEIQRIEQQIYIDVQNAIERVATLQRRLRSAERSVELAQESLNVEMRMLEEGRATSFQILQAQDSLSDARTRQLAALVDLKKAVVEVDVVSGRLLNQFGLSLSSVYDELSNKNRRILRWPIR